MCALVCVAVGLGVMAEGKISLDEEKVDEI
jgi:hypothetical protein